MTEYVFKPGKQHATKIHINPFSIQKTRKVEGIDFWIKIDESFFNSMQEFERAGEDARDKLKAAGIMFASRWWKIPFTKNNRDAVLISFVHHHPEERFFRVYPYLNKNFDFSWSDHYVKWYPNETYKASIDNIGGGIWKTMIHGDSAVVYSHEFEVNEGRALKYIPPYHGGSIGPYHEKRISVAHNFRFK